MVRNFVTLPQRAVVTDFHFYSLAQIALTERMEKNGDRGCIGVAMKEVFKPSDGSSLDKNLGVWPPPRLFACAYNRVHCGGYRSCPKGAESGGGFRH